MEYRVRTPYVLKHHQMSEAMCREADQETRRYYIIQQREIIKGPLDAVYVLKHSKKCHCW